MLDQLTRGQYEAQASVTPSATESRTSSADGVEGEPARAAIWAIFERLLDQLGRSGMLVFGPAAT
jgi:hypothetical protein